MNSQMLFNFIEGRERSNIILMSSDYEWLKDNIFKDTELFAKLIFDFEGIKYQIEDFNHIFLDGGPRPWSSEEHECYMGKPYNSNMHIYIKCKRVSS